MAGRAVLHIGTMKTGTTYLQSVLAGNNEPLTKSGVALPATFGRQAKAVSSLLKEDPSVPGATAGAAAWNRLARKAGRSSGHTAVFSMEFLSFARGHHVSRLVRPFQDHGVREIDVVLTVRDQFRVLPAQWQTFCRNTGTSGWADYLRAIEQSNVRPGARKHARAHRTFHRAQDVPTILEEWSAAPGVTRVHVITMPSPQAPRDELWRRFCEVLDVTPDGYDLDVAWQNVSLGYGSCDLLRRVNLHLPDVPGGKYRKGIRSLARGVLVGRREQESRPELDRRGARFARGRNEAIRDAVARGPRYPAGLMLRGDLDDLPVPADLSGFAARVSDAPEAEVRGAAEAARAFLSGVSGEAAGDARDVEGMAADVARLLRAANGW